jgi:hypothetical protein
MSPAQFFRSFLPTWFPLETAEKAETAQTAQTAQTDHRSSTQTGALDVIFLVGPDIWEETIPYAEEACRKQNLSAETINIAGAGSMEDLCSHLHGGGKLGLHTQIFLVCHGSVRGDGEHMLTFMAPPSANARMPTSEVLRSLRRGGLAEAGAGPCPKWAGTIHLISCGAGQLASEILPGSADWNEGNCIVHASEDTLLMHEGIQAVTQSLAGLAHFRDAGVAPDPRQMLAYAAHRTGDSVILLGSAVTRAAFVRPPAPTTDDVCVFRSGEWLRTRPELGLAENQAISGLQADPDDAAAILATMVSLDDEDSLDEARLREQRLQDILLTSVSHHNVHTVAMLLDARPDLAEARLMTGKTVEEFARKEGNEDITRAVLAKRLSNVGPHTLLYQACARGDHATALWLLKEVAPGQVSRQDMVLAMQLASENMFRTTSFFEGLLDAASKEDNHAARRCLTLAHQAGVLPEALRDRWETYTAGRRQQLDDDRRGALYDEAEASALPAMLADACRDGDAVLLRMLLQRCPLAPGMIGDRQRLLGFALASGHSAELLLALTDSALLHRDVETFRALGAEAAGLLFLRQHGRGFLEQACIGDRAELVACLLSMKAIDHGPDASGDTLLHLAAASGSVTTIALLLQNGHAIDQINRAGETALHAACREGQAASVPALLDAGATVGIANAAGETALDLAERECPADTVALMGTRQLDGKPVSSVLPTGQA